MARVERKLLVALALTDLIGLTVSPLSLASSDWPQLLLTLAGAIALVLLSHRVASGGRVHTFCVGTALTLVAWPLLRILNHLAMSVPLPLVDRQLAAADRWLHFDWIGYIHFLDRHPLLLELCGTTYGNLTGYSCLAFLILCACRPADRAREFVLLFLSAAVLTDLIGMFFPAMGAMLYFSPELAGFRHIAPGTGTYFWAPLQTLRSESHHVLHLSNLVGTVALPSFHTQMGLIMIYCSRGGRKLFVPVLLINALMIASTPLFGGHYLIDVLAGAMIVGSLVVAARTGMLPLGGKSEHRTERAPAIRL